MKALAGRAERRKLAEMESEESSDMSEEELSERDDVEEREDEGNESVFLVGDFVWGKIKNHPWWPGQIYDESDASELALKHKPKEKASYLVAYFGDGTFSWCSSSQLKSFNENFQSFSRQSSSKSFIFAVEDALSVLCELAAQETGCACVKKNRQVAKNAGIRKEVLVPMIGVNRLAAAQFDSAAVIASVRNAARLVSVENRLELVMLTSKLLAFYASKGYSELPKYNFPVYINGLEDISKRVVDVETVSVEDLVSNEDKLYERRRQKILTDTVKEEIDIDVQNVSDYKATPTTRRKQLIGQTDRSDKGSAKGRKRVARTSGLKDGADVQKDSVDKETPPTKRKRLIGQTDSSEKGKAKGRKRAARTSVVKDGADKSRDDKKKKDFVTPIASIKQMGFEPVVLNFQTDTQVGERMSKAAKLIIESAPIRKQCSIVFEKEPEQVRGMKNEVPFLRGDQAIKQGHEGIDPMPEDMISGLKLATFTPLRERPFGSKLDVFSLNKLSNNDTLMNGDDDEDDGRPLSAIIFMTFSPEVSVPSKADLLTKYREFGSLNEDETDVLPNSLCAQVRFIKKSEGEQAFNHMVKLNSADSGVQYGIRYIPRGSNFPELVENVHLKTSPQSSKLNDDNAQTMSINYLKQKLETLISKLSNVEGETLSNDLKNELRSEMTSLLARLG